VLGVILDEMRMYVVEEFGEQTWNAVMKKSGLPANHQYGLEQTYPDEALGSLAIRAAEVTGKPVADVLEGFGEAMVPDMFRFYKILVNPRWTFVDFLLGMEPVLHSALQLHAEGTPPPKVHATRTAPNAVTVVYDSPLRACSAVRGIIQGAATHYSVEIDLVEEQCALRGDPRCVMKVAIL
jgi:hypothetical protein